MIEVMPRLYVGNQIDWETNVKHKGTGNPKPGWSVVQACKEPYHREALGYIGRGAPPRPRRVSLGEPRQAPDPEHGGCR
jgi:hypothetical protein